jgi:hypothetical protein
VEVVIVPDAPQIPEAKPKPIPPRRKPTHVPVQPEPPDLEFVFTYHPSKRSLKVTGVVTPSPAVASDQDTDLTILVALNGNPAIALDAGAPPGVTVSFACNAGDTYVITQVDVNVVGPSAASAALTGTVPTIVIPPTSVPTTPGAPTVAFTNP